MVMNMDMEVAHVVSKTIKSTPACPRSLASTPLNVHTLRVAEATFPPAIVEALTNDPARLPPLNVPMLVVVPVKVLPVRIAEATFPPLNVPLLVVVPVKEQALKDPLWRVADESVPELHFIVPDKVAFEKAPPVIVASLAIAPVS
jgi:hypothetical protein